MLNAKCRRIVCKEVRKCMRKKVLPTCIFESVLNYQLNWAPSSNFEYDEKFEIEKSMKNFVNK